MDFKTIILGILFVFLGACSSEESQKTIPTIIPKPQSLEINEGFFVINKETKITTPKEFSNAANYLKEFLEPVNVEVQNSENINEVIRFILDKKITHKEGYDLLISRKEINIRASTTVGAFYAIQSLRQLLPVALEAKTINEIKEIKVPNVHIKDEPVFGYRGMHLDVGRHFFEIDFIKQYLDVMAMLKMNTFHWHLTEDQGWRIEIKKYPKLTSHAAYRDETLVGHYNDTPHQYDGKRYGGYYTQEQIKEVVAYATNLGITIIPEIEMPGHSQAAISAYPELGCTGNQVPVATKWGVFEEVYCPKEETFTFLENVLDEVINLFPGKYIHIGGDEAPKARWESCLHCQKLIEDKNLKDAHGLQSYFISRMEKYINSKGKQIIGWDEILEGGLAPNATVMSWRGMDGAISAAKEGHNVIMTPTSHCYFDYYQSDNEKEPLAIGGFLPLEKVYHFNPIPDTLTAKEAKYVLGAQGNVWTEYMKTSDQVWYMAFPRAVALSEVLWTTEAQRDYKNFLSRLEVFNKRLDFKNINYANHMYDINGELEYRDDKLYLTLSNAIDNKNIRYAFNDASLEKTNLNYVNAIPIDTSMSISAATYKQDKRVGNIFVSTIDFHKAVGAKITINKDPHPAYNSGGVGALINALNGNDKRFGDKEWLGFWGEDIEVVIDFGEIKDINEVNTRFFNANGQWIYAPKRVTTFVSNNGIDYLPYVESGKQDDLGRNEQLVVYKNKKSIRTRYVKLLVDNYGVIPEGKQGAGNKAWTFIDEIKIW